VARTVVTDKLLQDNLEFQGTESIRVPSGTTAQRGTPSGSGELRYNTELGTFEGYSGSAWGSLGGIIDVDQDTYITAEATSDKDSLDFWTDGTERMSINSTGTVTITGDLTVNGTTITLNSTTIQVTESIIFEGSTADEFETTLIVTNPTADRIITLPDATGTIAVAPFVGANGSAGTIGLVPAPAANDAALGKFLKADGVWTIVDTTVGTPTDTTFNDGAYYQASTVYQSGSVISGISTSGSIADALDGVNETIKNIHNNTYVQGAYFTRSPIEGGGSPGTPLVVRFTVLNPGDATHMDLEFDNTTENTSYTSVTNDTTWKNAGHYDYSFTDIAGGSVDVTMTLKCQSATGTTGLTEGSYFKYKFTAAVTLWEPDPAVLWTTTSGDQIVDLGSGTAADREIEFDTTTTLYAHYWMIEFGDGTKYPTSANTGGNNTHVQANWIDWSATKKYTYDYDANGSTVTADVRRSPKVWCRSITARGDAGFTNSLEKADHIECFITPIATLTADNLITGNNDELGDTNAQSATNTAEGHPVKFTNTSANLGTWGDTTYTWDWGDLTSNTIVTGGANIDGDVSNDIEHYFTLANDDVAETFDVTLKAQNNRENSNNHTTSATTITVKVDPRAGFSGAFVNQNTSASGSPSYVDSRIGYNFTKYNPTSGGIDSNGASNIVDFTNSSGGIGPGPSYAWTFNNTQTSTLSDPPNQAFTTAQAYNIQLITQNTNSYAGGTDDTELKSNYITINATPSTPPGLANLTIAVPSSTGTSPLACADTDDKTAGGGSAPTGGSAVTRIVTTTMTSNVLSNWANEFDSNGSYAGILTAHLNEGGATGTITFDGSNKVGTNGILEITEERDSNVRDSSIYPDNFFKEFKAKVNLTGLSAGFNTAQLKHDDGTNTAMTEFVYDDMTNSPTISAFGTTTQNAAGTLRYMSGVKFYNTGASLTVTGLQINNLTGQTYRNTSSPLTISSSTGTPIVSQDFTYTNLGVGAIPNKNLSPTSSALTVNISGSGSGKNGIIKSSAKNVNGTSSDLADTTKLMWWIASPTLDELALPNNIGVGGNPTAIGQRIKYTWTGTDYAYPGYTPGSNDWYTTYAWNSQTDTLMGTNEAGCYLNEIKHTLEDFSSGYLPIGNDLSTGRSSGATQYFTLAFKRKSVAKFAIKISGEVTSLYIAFPQYNTDLTSTLNGWLDCSIPYAGSGFPGANTGAGTPIGNSSNGVRRLGSPAQLGAFAINTALTDAYANLDLGIANTGLMTYPTVLVRFGVAYGKSVTAISLEDWS